MEARLRRRARHQDSRAEGPADCLVWRPRVRVPRGGASPTAPATTRSTAPVCAARTGRGRYHAGYRFHELAAASLYRTTCRASAVRAPLSHPYDVHAAGRAGADLASRPPEHEQRRVVGCGRSIRSRTTPRTRVGRRCEASRSAGARTRHATRVRERLHGGLSPRDAVRLVDDDDVPWAGGDGPQDLRPLDVVHRRNRGGERRPRVDANRQCRCQPSQHTPVDWGGADFEAPGQLVRPLFAQPRRRQNQHAVDRVSRQKLGHDQACLDRLAEADFVREQQPRASPARPRLARARADAASARCAQRCGAQRSWRRCQRRRARGRRGASAGFGRRGHAAGGRDDARFRRASGRGVRGHEAVGSARAA